MEINKELKDALLDMILDLGSHYSIDEQNEQEELKWFCERYIEPILKEYGANPCEEPKCDSVTMISGNEILSKDFFNNL